MPPQNGIQLALELGFAEQALSGTDYRNKQEKKDKVEVATHGTGKVQKWLHSGMLSRQKRADIRNLARKSYRIEAGRFIAEGQRAVEQMIRNARVEVETILTDGRAVDSGSIPVISLNKDAFSEISDTESSQGVIAVCRIPSPLSVNAICSKPGVLIALDAIQDPGNLGTLVRTAAWFGAAGILIGTGTTDLFQPKVVRSTAGATGMIPYGSGTMTFMLDEAAASGREILILDGGAGSISLNEVHPSQNAVIVIGNEGNGVSDEVLALPFQRVRIPGYPDHVESLNAAIAGSIALYHFHAHNAL